MFAFPVNVIGMLDCVLSDTVCLLFILMSLVCKIVCFLAWLPPDVIGMLDCVLSGMVCLLFLLMSLVC